MLGHIFLCLLLIFQTIEANGGRKWMTLNGGQPEVVARGGYSGFYPDSSQSAYNYALDTGILGTILYCNLHLTKDNDGFCLAQINLQNATDIENLDPKGAKSYNIYGQQVRGYFGLDYPANIIFENVTLRQNIYTRHSAFDGMDPIAGPFLFTEEALGKPSRLWLNIENNMFYEEHKMSPEAFILEQLITNKVLPEFISSPEIAFLKSIGPKLPPQTKLIFTFLEPTAFEPTTKVTYGSLAKNLAAIKSFASGIVVPKEYIWPVNMDRVLQPATSLVQDAHRAGLAVYASGFANDNYLSFNYSYDPAREYLQFFDNPLFSVDGVLSDFPSTASEAIGCLTQNNNAALRQIPALIISHNGASGDFPGATDAAYLKAIEDGADIIDCSVQMSKDGIAFCSDRPDLMKTTTAATLYMDQSTSVPQIQTTDGIFSFDLTWTQIQSLMPQIEDFFDGNLIRNPANKNSGKFVTLSEFLELAKTRSVTGVLVSVKNAAFLASKGLDLVGAVSAALSNATLSTQKRVLIQSDDTSVLLKFKDTFPSYERVLYIEESISGAPGQVAQEVKKYADAVFVHRDAIMVASDNFASKFTSTVPTLHAANISVYVGVLKNEFQNFIFDYLSDPYVELATFYSQQVDGFVTDYPATANSFVRSTCTTKGSAYLIPPVQPSIEKDDGVAEPPLLSTADVVDPPLPAIGNNETAQSANASATPTSAPKKSSTTSITVSARVLFLAALMMVLFT